MPRGNIIHPEISNRLCIEKVSDPQGLLNSIFIDPEGPAPLKSPESKRPVREEVLLDKDGLEVQTRLLHLPEEANKVNVKLDYFDLSCGFTASLKKPDGSYQEDTNIDKLCKWIQAFISPEVRNDYELAATETSYRNGLNSKDCVAYLINLYKHINAQKNNSFTRYGCMGPDISSALLATNAAKIEGLDQIYQPSFFYTLEKASQSDSINNFLQKEETKLFYPLKQIKESKCENNYWAVPLFESIPPAYLCLIELEALGIEKFEYNENDSSISFLWKHPCDKTPKKRTIQFTEFTFGRDDMKQLNGQSDVYMQKAAQENDFDQKILKTIKDEGCILSDSPAEYWKNIEAYPQNNALFKARRLDVPNVHLVNLFKGIHNNSGSYGAEMFITRKKDLDTENTKTC